MAFTYQILISKAEIIVFDSSNKPHIARALLDCASQSSFITKKFLVSLNTPKHDSTILVSGIGNVQSNISHCATITLQSKCRNYSKRLSCLVIDKITENIPHMSFPKEFFDIPEHIKLADEYFNESQHMTFCWVLMFLESHSKGSNFIGP